VIDELTEVGIQRRDAALFGIRVIGRGSKQARHRVGQGGEVRDIIRLRRSKDGRREIRNIRRTGLEKVKSVLGVQAARDNTVTTGHTSSRFLELRWWLKF